MDRRDALEASTEPTRRGRWPRCSDDSPAMRQVATVLLFYRQALTVGLRAVLYPKATMQRR